MDDLDDLDLFEVLGSLGCRTGDDLLRFGEREVLTIYVWVHI